jgi:hypothetical protein
MPPSKRFWIGLLASSIGFYSLISSSFAEVTKIELKAFPTHFEGICPFRFIFMGYITVNKPETIVYHFHRSDPSCDTYVRKLTFSAAGTYPVQTYWYIGGSSMRSFEGYESVEIMQGDSRVTSPLAKFTLSCTGSGVSIHNPQQSKLDELFNASKLEAQRIVTESMAIQSPASIPQCIHHQIEKITPQPSSYEIKADQTKAPAEQPLRRELNLNGRILKE